MGFGMFIDWAINWDKEQFIRIWRSIVQNGMVNTKTPHQTAFAALRGIQQVLPHSHWFRSAVKRHRAKQLEDAQQKATAVMNILNIQLIEIQTLKNNLKVISAASWGPYNVEDPRRLRGSGETTLQLGRQAV